MDRVVARSSSDSSIEGPAQSVPSHEDRAMDALFAMSHSTARDVQEGDPTPTMIQAPSTSSHAMVRPGALSKLVIT